MSSSLICNLSAEIVAVPVVSKTTGYIYEKSQIESYIKEKGKCPITGKPMTLDDLVQLQIDMGVSGEIAKVPVASKRTGHVYEKSVIENYIKENGKCPVSGEPMTFDDLILLRILKCPEIGGGNNEDGKGDAQDYWVPGMRKIRGELPWDTFMQLAYWCNDIKKLRKGLLVPSLATSAQIKSYTMTKSPALHELGKPGILSVDCHYSKNILATGGADGASTIYNVESGIISKFSGHSDEVTAIKFLQEDDCRVITGSTDKTVRLWHASENGRYVCSKVLTEHTAEVIAICIHNFRKHFVTASRDGSWCLYDLQAASCLVQFAEDPVPGRFSAAALHPYGLLLGTGTSEGLVKLWDMRSGMKTFHLEGHKGAVTSITFSENAYYFATAAEDGVKLWDYRMAPELQPLSSCDVNTPITSAVFDHSGRYLAIGGSDVRVYRVGSHKDKWTCLNVLLPNAPVDEGRVAALKFGPDAKYLAVGVTSEVALQIFGC